MDHDINHLTAIAQIAGIFVGFGALISVTRQAAVGVIRGADSCSGDERASGRGGGYAAGRVETL